MKLGNWDDAGFVTQLFQEQMISPPIPNENYPFVQYDRYSAVIHLNFIDFPVFNFSDLAINVSVAVIIILLLKSTKLKQL